MGIAVIIAQLILSLSILVVLHEFGHFIPAKLFKTKVEKFYLFFDPYFALFKKKIGETEYGVGWLPLGGYVKIAGMIDESMDKEQMAQPPQPWEFRSKPAWQRFIIMIGGVTVNFILGLLIFGFVLFYWGEDYVSTDNAVYGIAVSELGEELGLLDGDHVLKVGDYTMDRFNDRQIVKEVVLNDANTIEVRRNDEIVKLAVPAEMQSKLASNEFSSQELYTYRVPFVIGGFGASSPAKDAGLEVGDRIVGYNGQRIEFYDQFAELNSDEQHEVSLVIDRGGVEKSYEFTTNKNGLLGVTTEDLMYYFDVSRKDYSFAEAMPAGAKKGINFLGDQISAFGKMFSGKINPNESLGGFGSIAKLFPETWDWSRFWLNTGILSLILGFMNLLPIPALDGGHLMFLLYEIISGRKPSDKFMEYSTMVGFALLIALLLYANGLDILRAIG